MTCIPGSTAGATQLEAGPGCMTRSLDEQAAALSVSDTQKEYFALLTCLTELFGSWPPAVLELPARRNGNFISDPSPGQVYTYASEVNTRIWNASLKRITHLADAER